MTQSCYPMTTMTELRKNDLILTVDSDLLNDLILTVDSALSLS